MSKKPWEKVLYKKQNVPDNYVDKTFLSDMRKNVNLYKYSWFEALTGICVVTHEIASTVLFLVTFIYLKEDAFSISTVLAAMTSLILVSATIQQLTSTNWWIFDRQSANKHAKSAVIFILFGYMFSPVLKTLTQSISTDTIYATASLMLVTHVVFQDYGADAAIVSSGLSLNSALFAAVCLASRLPTVQHTFALVVLAVMSFVLLPLLRKRLKGDVLGLVVVTGLFVVVVFAALLGVSGVYATLFAVLCFCVNVLFPALFVYSQKYKENIFGPWDEAVVKTE